MFIKFQVQVGEWPQSHVAGWVSSKSFSCKGHKPKWLEEKRNISAYVTITTKSGK